MSDIAARLSELTPGEKRALLTSLVKLERSHGITAPLSYAQQRLWFLEQLVPSNPFYNESSAMRLFFPIDVNALEQSLNEIVQRHAALRTNFEAHDGEPIQRGLPSLRINLPILDLTALLKTEREGEAIRLSREAALQPFNLSRAPLFRALLLRLAQADHVFVLTMHHIVCDGWSMRIFFEELRILYEAFVLGRPSPLSPLAIQYVDFTVWQRERLKGPALEEQLAFWKMQLDGLPNLELQELETSMAHLQIARKPAHQ